LVDTLAKELPHCNLPALPKSSPGRKRSPRALLMSHATPTIQWSSSRIQSYLDGLVALGQVVNCASFRQFLTSNVQPLAGGDQERFWKSQVRKSGWLMKKKGDRAKLQKRWCLLKWKSLYYFKNETDLTPLGSIRLDLIEIEFYMQDEARGFTLVGGRKVNPRTFVCKNQGDADRWVSAIRSIKSAHDAQPAVQGRMRVRVCEGRNLACRDASIHGSPDAYVSVFAQSQQFHSETIPRSLNPTWIMSDHFTFDISHNCKWLHCLVWDAPSLLAPPSCMGEISIPVTAVAKGKLHDMWVPLSPQRWRQTVSGELHLVFHYDFVVDEKSDTESFEKKQRSFAALKVLMHHILSTESLCKLDGIFRVPARQNVLRKMYDIIMKGETLVLADYDPHAVCGLMKMLLRELPQPVIPFEFFDQVLELPLDAKNTQCEKWLGSMNAIVAQIPGEHQQMLHQLLQFLQKLAENEQDTRMGVDNLATVFGPTLLRTREDTMESLLLLPKINLIAKTLILHHTEE